MAQPNTLPGVPDDQPPAYNTGVPQQPIQQQPMAQPYGQPMAQPYGQPMAQPYGQPYAQQSQTNTTVIINQMAPQGLLPWSSGLFACFEDMMSCAFACFCPGCFACYLATNAGESCCLPICVPGWLIALRAHVRGKQGLEGSVLNDCCTVTCCYQCAACQLSRQIDNAKKNGKF